MARRSASFQQLFLDTLDGVGQTAMQAGKLVGDSRRANAADTRAQAQDTRESEAHTARMPGVKADAKSRVLDYEKTLNQTNLQKAMDTAAGVRTTAQGGTPTADGHAVDFQAVKKANQGFEQSDMNLWNALNPGNPMDAGRLKEKRERDDRGAEADVAKKESEADLSGLMTSAAQDPELQSLIESASKPEDFNKARAYALKMYGPEVANKVVGTGTRTSMPMEKFSIYEGGVEGGPVGGYVVNSTGSARPITPATAPPAAGHGGMTPPPKGPQLSRPGRPEGNLPMDVKKQIETLSTKSAGKMAIANQLQNDLLQMRKAMGQDETGAPIDGAKPNEDLAYTYAQNMLKTMNSKEGADAVGVDEARRAAGLLEYNVADVKAGLGMKPGKFHGRDIPGFLKQVESNVAGIKGAVDFNKAEIDKLYGRPSADSPSSPSGAPKAGDVDEGYRFKGGDPADPNNWEQVQ